MNQMRGYKSKGLVILGLAAFLIIVFFSQIANFLIDYQWFKELNYTEVFFKKLVTQLQFFVPSFIILFIIFLVYLKSINTHSVKNSGVVLSDKQKGFRSKIFIGISLLLSLFFSLGFVSGIWYDFLTYINQSGFGIADPIFGRDIGFYIFVLPFLNKLYGFLMGLLFVLAVIALLFNGFTLVTTHVPNPQEAFNVRPIYNPKNIYHNILSAASKQLLLLGSIFFLLLAGRFYLSIYELLYSTRGVAYGASYTDIFVNLPAYYVYIGLSLLSAVLMLFAWGKRSVKMAAFAPVLLVIAIVGSGVISAGVQQFVVNPNELAKEERYLQNNINYTNYAYGLDKVTEKEFDVKQNLTREDIEENRITINNIPINDYRPTKDVYNQLQGLKNYYQFNDIDIDRYTIDGTYRQVFVSARELQSNNIPKQAAAQSASWINRYLKYTHGYGVTMSPVNEVTPSGLPRLFLKDMPVTSEVDIKVDRPQIYFGEMMKDFAIVNTREKEFDYPSSNASVETYYEGTGGIKLNTLNRLMFAAQEGKMNFLLSQDLNAESRILINRDIEQRVRKIAPFLRYDEDPYVVVSEGKLYWIIDAYTVSSRYPYSEPYSDQSTANYIRNSVKVVIDAYNGTTSFYIADANDPIIQTYAKIFKTLFKPLDAMSADLRAHIRYPQMLFDIQADIYRKYHMTTARDLYNKSDVWDIATQIYGASGEQTERQQVESSYLIMRLPGSEKEEFLLINPYTPQGKNNMTSWLAVKNDGENYGEMILYRFPTGKIVEGPMQVEGIISQDTIIGPQLNLLATGGNSQVVRGNMLTIPVEDSLLYVEPIYVRAANANALPELKKVILFYKNQVVMEDTFERALERVFPVEKPKAPQEPQAPTAPPAAEPGAAAPSSVELIQKANTLFQQAQDALKAGNWAEYGSKMSELEAILRQLGTTAAQGQGTAQ